MAGAGLSLADDAGTLNGAAKGNRDQVAKGLQALADAARVAR